LYRTTKSAFMATRLFLWPTVWNSLPDNLWDPDRGPDLDMWGRGPQQPSTVKAPYLGILKR